MAERRMFSKTVVNSARFLRMPQTSRLLYYDLGMAADDDGIVEAFTVIRTTGAAEDDLRVLASKGFIVVLNEDLVSFISDWTVNNQIRKDRYTPSVYAELLVQVELSDGTQPATNGKPVDNQMTTNGLPNGNQRLTQYSIGKVSEVKDSIGEEKKTDKPPRATRFTPPSVDEVRAYCAERRNSVDAQRFVDFYQSKGWRIGKETMRDWKAAVRTWERRDGRGDIRTPSKYKYQEDESL